MIIPVDSVPSNEPGHMYFNESDHYVEAALYVSTKRAQSFLIVGRYEDEGETMVYLPPLNMNE